MSARFDDAIKVTLAHEGGYVCDPDDPGGATNYGISLRWLHSIGLHQWTPRRVREMTVKQAIDFYRRYWWIYSSLEDQTVATKIFDMSVNMGHTQAHKLAQRALIEIGHVLVVDGIFGPNTCAACNDSDESQLINGLRVKQIDFYRSLVRSRPRLSKFLPIWLKRASWPVDSFSMV